MKFRLFSPGKRRQSGPASPLAAARRLMRERDLYRTVADSTYDCEVWLSPSGAPRYVSPSCLRLTGRPAENAVGDPDFFRTIVLPEDYPAWSAALAASFRGEARSVDYRIVKPGGAVVHVAQEAALVPGGKGAVQGLHLSLRDVTDRVRAENALREAHEKLEERVRERTAELDRANADLRREVMRNRRILKELERSREELRALSNYLQDRIEEERTWISREIHDELGQDLTACNLGLFRLEAKLAANDPGAGELAAGLREILAGALSSARRLSRRLRPPILDELGFVQAAQALVKVFAETTGIGASVTAAPGFREPETERAAALYRALQEALTNAARHSGAANVAVRLSASRSAFILEVEDDGVGIARDSAENPKSFGLIGMRERLRSFGGDLRAKPLKGRGTLLRARVRRKGTA